MIRFKLSTKIAWNYAIVFTVVLLVINFAVFLSTQFYVRAQSSQEVVRLFGRVEQVLLREGGLREDALEELAVTPPFFFQVTGTRLSMSSHPAYGVLSDATGTRLRKVTSEGTETTDRILVRESTVPTATGVYRLVVGKDLSIYRFMNTVTLVTLVLASILGIFLSFVVGAVISRRSFSPIVSMTKSAAAIGPANLHQRIQEPRVEDELKELSKTFNSMLDRLEDAYAKQAQFVSDASHELRTPLTVIKGYNDLLLRWGKEDKAVLEEAMEAIRGETLNMTVLVENLLFIAKGENRRIQLAPERFDVTGLLEETAKDYGVAWKNRTFEAVGAPLWVVQDRRMIKQLLRIFIDNSIKFTKDGGTITLSVTPTAEGYDLRIRDQGDGIPLEDQDRIFERFYVAEKARTKDKAGAGLGLSIAKWIVEAHGGVIQVLSKPGQGTTMVVHFFGGLAAKEEEAT